MKRFHKRRLSWVRLRHQKKPLDQNLGKLEDHQQARKALVAKNSLKKRKPKTESDESIDDSDFDPDFSARMLLNAGKCRFLKPI